MRIRYSGDDESRDLAVAGGFITCPRMEWVDVEATAEANGIAVDHALVVAREVVKQSDWQHEGATKAARTRKRAAKKAAPEVEPTATPEEGDQ